MKKTVILGLFLLIMYFLLALPIEINQSDTNHILKKKACIIICPGSGYHKDLPLIKNLYEEAEKSGLHAVRFNWTYFTNKEKASKNYENELKDINDLIELIKKEPEIDTTKIYLAGKSLGSVLAYRVAKQRNDLHGLILLTPIFPDSAYAMGCYPDFDKLKIPVFIAVGANDSDNCDLKVLYGFMSKAQADQRIYVAGGDHSFNLETYIPNKESLANSNNVNNVIKNIVYWLEQDLLYGKQ